MIAFETVPPRLRHDFHYCHAIAREREGELLLRSQFVSRRVRPCWDAIFAFMWTAQDFVGLKDRDDDFKLQLVDDWARRLDLARGGHADHPIFRALAHVLAVTLLPERWLHELLIALRMDITNRRHANLPDLLDYCRFGANPLGRMILHLGHEVSWAEGVPETDKERHSDALWSAMRLTCLWRDVGRYTRPDAPIYLPLEEMDHFGVTEEMVLARRYTPMLGSLLVHLTDRTRVLFFEGEPLLAQVAWPLRLELAAAMERGLAILDRIEACGGNILRNRPVLTQQERLSCLWRAFGRGAAG
ncbi:MAG: squalene/phytoene synthase family protein [Magnetococcales bacterium]|nr:squalene/phytoene synthase family protein [Magnetococcales bacterium]